MYFLKNKKTSSSAEDNNDSFLHLTQRLSLKRAIPKLSCNLDQPHSLQKQKQNVGTPGKEDKRYGLSKGRGRGLGRGGFQFLAKNTELMNRTLNIVTVRNHEHATKMKKAVLQSIKKNQTKLDKIRKEEWISMHKRVAANLARFNDNEERKVYRSLKKYLQKPMEAFVANQQKCKCYEGIFPMSRLNSNMITMLDRTTLKQKLILVGGLSPQMSTIFHIHQYKPAEHLWQKIDGQLINSPQFNLSQHLVLAYQKNIFVIGGIAVIPALTEHKNQRYNIPFISTYNFKTSKWSRMNWNVYLRSHAGATFANYAIIDGGLSEQDKTSNKIFMMDMTKSQPPTLVSSRGLGLNHHKIVSTEAFEDKSRSFLKYDGLFCFGGKKQDGQLNETLYLMNYEYRCSEVYDKFAKFEWIPVETYGKSPRARYMHSMDLLETRSNIFERKAYCAILGGIGEKQTILNDFWLLDLSSMEWCQVFLTPSECVILQNGIAGHCTATSKNKIFIFGGYNSTRQHISKFWTITTQNNFQSTKKQHRIQPPKQQQ